METITGADLYEGVDVKVNGKWFTVDAIDDDGSVEFAAIDENGHDFAMVVDDADVFETRA